VLEFHPAELEAIRAEAIQLLGRWYRTPLFAGLLEPWCIPGTHCAPGASTSNFTIVGYHENYLQLSGDVGWDEYSVTLLKNGYVFYSLVTDFKNFDNAGSASNVNGFVPGSPSTSFSMQWSVDGDMIYYIMLYAIGPAGLAPI
jgi:hypothetical protein